MTAQPLFSRAMEVAQRVKTWGGTPAATRLRKGFNALLSILILFLLARAIARVGWEQVVDVVPANPLFWLLFLGSYFLPPLTEWIIYRRWWKFGWPAFAVFLRMRVMNDALFSYSGHSYLLVWATRHLGIEFDPKAPPPRILGRGDGPGVDPASSPFAAVKDMAITSGLAGIFSTLVLLLLALGMDGADVLGTALDPRTLRVLIGSFAALLVLNLGILAFRGNVMSLPPRENLFAFRWHLCRVLLAQALLVGSWAVALPGIAFETWFLLGALRMVIMRMPVPNKEILFAAIAVSLTGDASLEIAALMAAQGALQLVLHVVSWAGAGAIDAAAGRSGGVDR
ncbi:hypothetical protein L6Q21_02630 [Sandaracinobacter sp. RS1-74]|uniref:hypothetical protein n=1 Tax=Sandaracinobacteroides sayramensis TaxID=2913411 RepID=UPI001EDA0CCA|nr:hypothetical protein [Sandaracinobacteroides sayramensis]MCG2839877.1 hypothetical protein [Sandaracinobacteroides sayramensis]